MPGVCFLCVQDLMGDLRGLGRPPKYLPPTGNYLTNLLYYISWWHCWHCPPPGTGTSSSYLVLLCVLFPLCFLGRFPLSCHCFFPLWHCPIFVFPLTRLLSPHCTSCCYSHLPSTALVLLLPSCPPIMVLFPSRGLYTHTSSGIFSSSSSSCILDFKENEMRFGIARSQSFHTPPIIVFKVESMHH